MLMLRVLLLCLLLLPACDAEGETGPKTPPPSGPVTPAPPPSPSAPPTEEFGKLEDQLSKLIEKLSAQGDTFSQEQMKKFERALQDLIEKKEAASEGV